MTIHGLHDRPYQELSHIQGDKKQDAVSQQDNNPGRLHNGDVNCIKQTGCREEMLSAEGNQSITSTIPGSTLGDLETESKCTIYHIDEQKTCSEGQNSQVESQDKIECSQDTVKKAQDKIEISQDTVQKSQDKIEISQVEISQDTCGTEIPKDRVEEQAKTSNATWYFNTKIGGIESQALFDTGSPVSLISREIYEQMRDDKPPLETTSSEITAANGTAVKIFGKASFEFFTGVKTYTWSFLVADIKGGSCIVGQDFIGSQGRSLKWSNLAWKTKAGVVQLFSLDSNTVGKIHVVEQVSIPPRSKMFVEGKIENPVHDKVCMVEPLVSLRKNGVMVAKSLVDGDGKPILSVMNLTDKPIKLRQGNTLGNICPVTMRNDVRAESGSGHGDLEF